MAGPRGVDRAVEVAGGVVATAYHLGVTPAAVYKWLAVGGVPLTAYAVGLSRLSGVPVEALVPDTAPPIGPKSTALARAKRKRSRRTPVIEG